MMMKYINILILLVTISSVMTAPNKGYKEQKMEKVDIDNHKNSNDSLFNILCMLYFIIKMFKVLIFSIIMYYC